MVSNDVDFGHWVRERRKARGWTQERLADELTASGWAVSRNWIVQVEKGSKPSGDFVDAVENLLGRYTPPRAEPAPVDQSDVAAAIDRNTAALRDQTAAITALLERFGEQLVSPTELDEARVRAWAQAQGFHLGLHPDDTERPRRDPGRGDKPGSSGGPGTPGVPAGGKRS